MTTSSVLRGHVTVRSVAHFDLGKRFQSGDMCEEMNFSGEFNDDVDGFERWMVVDFHGI